MKKKMLAILAIITMLALVPASVLYGQDTPGKIGGELTPEISWRIEDGVLYLSGQGVVPTTMLGTRSAWYDYRANFHSVVIEDGITGVGQNVFMGYNITSLTVAGSVRDLAPNSFRCKKLSVVEVKGAIPPDIGFTVFYGVKYKKAKLVVPAGTKAAYEADPLWRKFITMEESAEPPTVQPAPDEALTEPCIIHLRRSSNFISGGAKLSVFLNGVEQQKIGNGQTVMLQTDRLKNELYIIYGKKLPYAVRRFDATAGGDIHIDFSIFLGNLKIVEEGEESQE
ncbi:MAG: hypothetical protein LBE91_18170 [Tannerella sp.]|jgi:hypothetical protein|nr:hypothetical protein [Tannerella sp.]